MQRGDSTTAMSAVGPIAPSGHPQSIMAVGQPQGMTPNHSPLMGQTHVADPSNPTLIALPPELARRVPQGHTLHRFTGTLEHTRTDNYNGQRNFILHPIAGDEAFALRITNGYMGVTDLQIEELNGHPVWIYGFRSVHSNLGTFYIKSRANGASTIQHNPQAIQYIFEPAKQLGTAANLALQGLRMATGVKVTRIVMSTPEAHKLILDIRSYLDFAHCEAPTQGARL